MQAQAAAVADNIYGQVTWQEEEEEAEQDNTGHKTKANATKYANADAKLRQLAATRVSFCGYCIFSYLFVSFVVYFMSFCFSFSLCVSVCVCGQTFAISYCLEQRTTGQQEDTPVLLLVLVLVRASSGLGVY